MAKAGKGRNQIVYELGLVNIHVSAGSVSSFLKEDRSREQLKMDRPITTSSEETQVGVKKNKGLLIVDHIITNTQDFEKNGYAEDIKKGGGPLSWLIEVEAETPQTDQSIRSEIDNTVTAVNSIPEKVINASLEPDVDFADTPYQEQSEISKTVNHIQEDVEIDFSDSPTNLDIEEEGFLLDSDPAVIWPKLLKQIKHEKDQRLHQILVLERKKEILDIREDQMNHDLEQLEGIRLEISNREARIYEAEPLLSLARQFQSMDLDFDSPLPYIECLREQAAGGINYKTAATYMVYEIKSYRQLGGIQKELVSARNQLQILKSATAQRERDLNMLAELENKGVSLDVIYGLSKVLDLEKIAAELALRTDPWSSIIPRPKRHE
jgi:hypothetical protein